LAFYGVKHGKHPPRRTDSMNKTIKVLIRQRRTWLVDNLIQDWTDKDTEHVALAYCSIMTREIDKLSTPIKASSSEMGLCRICGGHQCDSDSHK
jgi:hypothetical protein